MFNSDHSEACLQGRLEVGEDRGKLELTLTE